MSAGTTTKPFFASASATPGFFRSFRTAGTMVTPLSECGVAGPAYFGALLPSSGTTW